MTRALVASQVYQGTTDRCALSTSYLRNASASPGYLESTGSTGSAVHLPCSDGDSRRRPSPYVLRFNCRSLLLNIDHCRRISLHVGVQSRSCCPGLADLVKSQLRSDSCCCIGPAHSHPNASRAHRSGQRGCVHGFRFCRNYSVGRGVCDSSACQYA